MLGTITFARPSPYGTINNCRSLSTSFGPKMATTI